MEVIGLILVIIFALVSSGDRKKKAAQRAQMGQPGRPEKAGAAARAARRTPKAADQASMLPRRTDEPVMPSNAKSTFEASLTELKELLNVAETMPAEGESMLLDADCHGGSMPHAHAEGNAALDDAECAGGSMPHAHTQGVSRSAQKQQLAELDHRREAEAPEALIPQTIDARALRRAVVMAEVLGRPRALRRNG